MADRFSETFTLESPTGAYLSCRHEPARKTKRAVLILCHGLSEHSGRYAPFAGAMAENDVEVFALDHRGHGLTTADDAPLGQFAARDGWQKAIADVMALHAHAAKANAGLPILLFGHSMGGLIAWNTIISHPRAFAGVVIWNANFEGGMAGRAAQAILAVERALKGSDVPSPLLSRLTFETWNSSIKNRQTDHDWLSRDRQAVQAFIDDPLCGRDASVGLWRDVFALVYRGGKPVNWRTIDRRLPIHLVGGGEDPGTNRSRAVKWFGEALKREGFRDVTLVVYPEFRHETLNEIGAERAVEDFTIWVDQTLSRSMKS